VESVRVRVSIDHARWNGRRGGSTGEMAGVVDLPVFGWQLCAFVPTFISAAHIMWSRIYSAPSGTVWTRWNRPGFLYPSTMPVGTGGGVEV
jgi:hypothetical protein